MSKENARKKILIVDDAPPNLRVLVEILKAEYEISVATRGAEAVEIATSDESVDLILLDIVMPEMDGYEVCRILKNDPKAKDIPVVFVTANTDDETLITAFKAGGADYVRKPVNKVELSARIRSALDHQELTKRLIEEERLRGVLEMAGAVCHELSQPMQAISGFSQLLMDKMTKDSPIYERLRNIKEQIERMSELTERLRRITRYETCDYVDDIKIIDIYKASGVK